MKTIPITVEIPLSDLTPQAIHDAIIAAAVDRVLDIHDDMSEDEDGNVARRMNDRYLRTLREQVRTTCEAKIRAIVDQKAPEIVDDVLRGEFQPTNIYGERRGETTTIREMVMGMAKTWMETMVDQNGSTSGYGDNRHPRLQWVLRKEIDKAMTDTLAAEVKAAAAEVKPMIAGKLSGAIAETINRILGVK
jgi:hypothetical protein